MARFRRIKGEQSFITLRKAFYEITFRSDAFVTLQKTELTVTLFWSAKKRIFPICFFLVHFLIEVGSISASFFPLFSCYYLINQIFIFLQTLS